MSNPYESPQTPARNVHADYLASDWFAQTELDTDTAARATQDFFLAEGYRLEAGDLHNAVYGIGSNVMRILLGGFVKRNKFKVQIVPAGAGSNVLVDKGMSGMMGGALGYAKMKKELARIREGVQFALRQPQS